MESFEEPGHINRDNLLEVPTLSDPFSEDEDVKATHQHRFSPGLRRRNSDSSEEMESEAPSTISRKVSFADAFGFDLVSVKEFDTWEVPNTSPSEDSEDVEEFYLTPLFITPTTQEELMQKVHLDKVCLESVEYLPGITCMKGIVRVLNISFEKLVYVRMSLDNWLTYYDILGEYVPNSCDGETDQFLFKISLVPPYQREGAKVEFCIRYETSVGIFWSNNNDQNYILICHKKDTASLSGDNNLKEEVTNKHIKGCLKATLSSKEETPETADEDICNNNSRISESHIPKILCSHVDDIEIEHKKKNEEVKNVEHNEEDENENENEKELELLLSQHFSRSRDSSRDERSLCATEPVRFPNELQELGDKLDSGLLRQPLPVSSSSEHALQDKDQHNRQTFSIGNDRQLPLEKSTLIAPVNNSGKPSEGFSSTETHVSPEHWSETKENQTVHISDVISGKHGMHHADTQNDDSNNVPGSKTPERLFTDVDDYSFNEVWEARPKTITLEPKAGHLKENAFKRMDNNSDQLMQEITSQLPELNLENILRQEPKSDKVESQQQLNVNRSLNTNTLADADVIGSSFVSSHSEHDILEEKDSPECFKKGKGTKLKILEQFPEEQMCSINRYRKHDVHDNYHINVADKLIQGGEIMTSSDLNKKKDEMHRTVQSPYLNDCGNSGENISESKTSIVSESSHDLEITEIRHSQDQNTDKLWKNYTDSKTSTTQMKEQTGGEALWGTEDNTRYLNVSSSDELFACQNPTTYEKTSVSKHENSGEAEGVVTAAYIIKMSSKTTPEKMSSDEKAVIVKIPQQTALNDRLSEKKERVLSVQEGKTDGSRYPLCQHDTVTVLNDTEFENEYDSDIYNANTHKAVQMKMASENAINKLPAIAEPNCLDNSLFTETLWTSEERKTVLNQSIYSEVPPESSECSPQGLCNEETEERSIWRSVSHITAATEQKPSGFDKNMVDICDKHFSTSSPGLQGGHAADLEKMLQPYIEATSTIDISTLSGGNLCPTSEGAHANPINANPQEYPPNEKRESSIGHQSENQSISFLINKKKQIEPTIREPNEKEEVKSTNSEDLITKENLDIVGQGNQPFFDNTGISDQHSEAYILPSDHLVLKHIAYKILYFLFFIVFCVTLYHYDLIVCFVLYLFSLYWLYCEGRKSKESVKKE